MQDGSNPFFDQFFPTSFVTFHHRQVDVDLLYLFLAELRYNLHPKPWFPWFVSFTDCLPEEGWPKRSLDTQKHSTK